MCGEMGWCGERVVDGMVPPQSPSPCGVEDWDVWMPHPNPPPISRKKNRGLHPTTLVPAFLSLHLPDQK